MGQKVAGTCYVKVDGKQVTLKGGIEAPISDKKRETIVTGFFKEEELPPYIKMTAVHTPNFPRKALVDGTDMTITAELKNGKVYTLSGAYMVDEPSSNGEEGTIELQFDGIKGVWS
jgi:hypothetical protein